MQSCQVPLLVRKCLRPLIHRNSKSSGRPLLGFGVPSRLPPSGDLLFRSLLDELSVSGEESLDESELVVSEEALNELYSSDESVSARLAFFRLSGFRRFCSFLARFFALTFAFFFFSLSRCFLFLASSLRRRLPSLSSPMMTFQISYAITPMGTSSTLFFAMVSTIFDSLRTHFGAPFRFRTRRTLSLFIPADSSCKESNSILAIVSSSSIGTSVPPARS